MLRKGTILLIALGTLTACGYSKQERAISGALIGAGVGAVGSAITHGNPLGGALLGGAVGAAAGAVTGPDQVDLGRPVWKRNDRYGGEGPYRGDDRD